MNSLRFVCIGLIALLGSVAVQGYGTRRYNKPHRPPHKSSHRPSHGLHKELRHEPHGLPDRPLNRHLERRSGFDSEPDYGWVPWDSGDDYGSGPPFWDKYDKDRSGPRPWERDDDNSSDHSNSSESDEFFDDSDWPRYFYTKRPPEHHSKWTTTKKPRRKTTTPSPTRIIPLHITPHNNRPPCAESAVTEPLNPSTTTWFMTKPTPESTTVWVPRGSTQRPTRTVSPTPRPPEITGSISETTRTTWDPNTLIEATNHWDATTSSPEPTTNTDEEIPTLSPEVLNCIETCISTPEFNPVCGTDGVTYDNEGKLFCAKSCGVDVTLRRRSVCPPPIFDGDDDDGGVPPPTPPPTMTTSPAPWGRTTLFSSFQRCMRQCHITPSFTPVCGTDLETYMNIDRLECAQSCGKVVEVLCERPCAACGFDPVTATPKTTTFVSPITENYGRITVGPDIKDCISACPATSEYNPVCGSNHVTYSNPSHLLCAQLCGVAVRVVRLSPCSPTTSSTTTPEPPSTTLSPGVLDCIRRCRVTTEYNPVCGTDNLTYTNIGNLHCAQYCGIDVDLQLNTRCLDDFGAPPNNELSTSSTTEKLIANKDEGTISLRSTSTTIKELTTSSSTLVTTPSTTQATTPSTTQETRPSSTLTTTPTPILNTLDFIIPQEILNSIFGSTTTQPPVTTITTNGSDENVDLDARFGNPTNSSIDQSKIIFPE